MTAFFIPGVVGDARRVEDAYGEMRSRIEFELGVCRALAESSGCGRAGGALIA